MKDDLETKRMDAELERMVNRKDEMRRRREQRETRCMDAEYTVVEPKWFWLSGQELMQVFSFAARAGVGCVFLGAINHGLVEPALGVVAAAVCFLRAIDQLGRERYARADKG